MRRAFASSRAGAVTRMVSLHAQRLGKGSTSFEELQTAVQSFPKGVILCPEKLIRQIIRLHRPDLSVLQLRLPRTESYVLPRDEFEYCLKTYLPKKSVEIPWELLTAEFVTLLVQPTQKELASRPLEYFTLRYWGYLFHSEIHKWWRRHLREHPWSRQELQQAIFQIDPLVFEEGRNVLSEENRLFDPYDDQEVLEELSAYFLQLYYFSPHLVGAYFPSLVGREEAIVEVFEKLGIPVEQSLENSRLPHTPSVKEVLEAPHRQLLRELRGDVFRAGHHVSLLLEHPLWEELWPDDEKRKNSLNDLKPFVECLVGHILQDGKITGSLSFLQVRDLAVRRGEKLLRHELFTLDRVLADHFATLYRPASLWERFCLLLRSPLAIEKDSCDEGRKAVTLNTLRELEKWCQRLEEAESSRKQLWLLRGKFWLWFITLGWLISFVGSRFHLWWNWALAWRDCWAIWQFALTYQKALYTKRRQRWIPATVFFRQCQLLVNHVAMRYELVEGSQLQRHLEEALLDHIEPLCRHLAEHLAPGRDALFRELILYLVGRMSLGGSRESQILWSLYRSLRDTQRKVYAFRPFRWLLRLGREPLLRELSYHPQLKGVRHLRRACELVNLLYLPERIRKKYTEVLEKSLEVKERAFREQLAGAVEEALGEVFPPPKGIREKLSWKNIPESLACVILEKGYSHFSDLRDTFSRYHLKLEDLQTWEVFFGDRLLRLDKKLCEKLPGLHQSAEIYLRFLQVLSSMFFGTPVGRWTSKYLIFPFGSAFFTLLLVDEAVHFFRGTSFHLLQPQWIGVLGALILLSLVFPAIPKGVYRYLLKPLWHSTTATVHVLRSVPLAVYLGFVYPLLSALGVVFSISFALERFYGTSLSSRGWYYTLAGGYIVFLCFFFSSWGRWLTAVFAELFAEKTRHILIRPLAALVQGLIFLSWNFIHWTEYLVSKVSSLLQFVQGEGKGSAVLKGIVLCFWTPISYVLTLYVRLFLEPQVNPLKFPAVSISYKAFVVNPALNKSLYNGLFWSFSWILPVSLAHGFALFTVFVFTGAVGFLFWELHENWYLYKHNLPQEVGVGTLNSRGETVVKLLRGGFHAQGELPKLFAQLREAYREGASTLIPSEKLAHFQRRKKQIVKELSEFVEHELFLPLQLHPLWKSQGKGDVSKVELTPNTVTLELELVFGGERGMGKLAFQERKGHLIAQWQGRVPFKGEQLQLWNSLLYVFCHRAGMECSQSLFEQYLRENFGEQWRERGIFYVVEEEYLYLVIPEKRDKVRSALARLRRRLQSIVPSDKHNVPWSYFESRFPAPRWRELEALFAPPYLFPPYPKLV